VPTAHEIEVFGALTVIEGVAVEIVKFESDVSATS
jgi:hypothetical protein